MEPEEYTADLRSQDLEAGAKLREYTIRKQRGDELSPEELAEIPVLMESTKRLLDNSPEDENVYGDAFKRGALLQPAQSITSAAAGVADLIPGLDDVADKLDMSAQKQQLRMTLPDIAPTGAPGEGVVEMAGNVLPTIGALIASAYTGGAAAGLVSSGFYGAQAFGAGRNRVRNHLKDQGEETNEYYEALGGFMYGAAEMGAEYAGFKILSRIGGKSLRKGMEKMTKELNKRDPGFLNELVAGWKTFTVGAALEEGSEEAFTEWMQNFTDRYVTQVDPDGSLMQGVAGAFGAGALMGPLVGPAASFARVKQSHRISNRVARVIGRGQDPDQGRLSMVSPEGDVTFRLRPILTPEGDFAPNSYDWVALKEDGTVYAEAPDGGVMFEKLGGDLFQHNIRTADTYTTTVTKLDEAGIQKVIDEYSASPYNNAWIQIDDPDFGPYMYFDIESFKMEAPKIVEEGRKWRETNAPPTADSPPPADDEDAAASAEAPEVDTEAAAAPAQPAEEADAAQQVAGEDADAGQEGDAETLPPQEPPVVGGQQELVFTPTAELEDEEPAAPSEPEPVYRFVEPEPVMRDAAGRARQDEVEGGVRSLQRTATTYLPESAFNEDPDTVENPGDTDPQARDAFVLALAQAEAGQNPFPEKQVSEPAVGDMVVEPRKIGTRDVFIPVRLEEADPDARLFTKTDHENLVGALRSVMTTAQRDVLSEELGGALSSYPEIPSILGAAYELSNIGPLVSAAELGQPQAATAEAVEEVYPAETQGQEAAEAVKVAPIAKQSLPTLRESSEGLRGTLMQDDGGKHLFGEAMGRKTPKGKPRAGRGQYMLPIYERARVLAIAKLNELNSNYKELTVKDAKKLVKLIVLGANPAVNDGEIAEEDRPLWDAALKALEPSNDNVFRFLNGKEREDLNSRSLLEAETEGIDDPAERDLKTAKNDAANSAKVDETVARLGSFRAGVELVNFNSKDRKNAGLDRGSIIETEGETRGQTLSQSSRFDRSDPRYNPEPTLEEIAALKGEDEAAARRAERTAKQRGYDGNSRAYAQAMANLGRLMGMRVKAPSRGQTATPGYLNQESKADRDFILKAFMSIGGVMHRGEFQLVNDEALKNVTSIAANLTRQSEAEPNNKRLKSEAKAARDKADFFKKQKTRADAYLAAQESMGRKDVPTHYRYSLTAEENHLQAMDKKEVTSLIDKLGIILFGKEGWKNLKNDFMETVTGKEGGFSKIKSVADRRLIALALQSLSTKSQNPRTEQGFFKAQFAGVDEDSFIGPDGLSRQATREHEWNVRGKAGAQFMEWFGDSRAGMESDGGRVPQLYFTASDGNGAIYLISEKRATPGMQGAYVKIENPLDLTTIGTQGEDGVYRITVEELASFLDTLGIEVDTSEAAIVGDPLTFAEALEAINVHDKIAEQFDGVMYRHADGSPGAVAYDPSQVAIDGDRTIMDNEQRLSEEEAAGEKPRSRETASTENMQVASALMTAMWPFNNIPVVILPSMADLPLDVLAKVHPDALEANVPGMIVGETIYFFADKAVALGDNATLKFLHEYITHGRLKGILEAGGIDFNGFMDRVWATYNDDDRFAKAKEEYIKIYGDTQEGRRMVAEEFVAMMMESEFSKTGLLMDTMVSAANNILSKANLSQEVHEDALRETLRRAVYEAYANPTPLNMKADEARYSVVDDPSDTIEDRIQAIARPKMADAIDMKIKDGTEYSREEFLNIMKSSQISDEEVHFSRIPLQFAIKESEGEPRLTGKKIKETYDKYAVKLQDTVLSYNGALTEQEEDLVRVSMMEEAAIGLQDALGPIDSFDLSSDEVSNLEKIRTASAVENTVEGLSYWIGEIGSKLATRLNMRRVNSQARQAEDDFGAVSTVLKGGINLIGDSIPEWASSLVDEHNDLAEEISRIYALPSLATPDNISSAVSKMERMAHRVLDLVPDGEANSFRDWVGEEYHQRARSLRNSTDGRIVIKGERSLALEDMKDKVESAVRNAGHNPESVMNMFSGMVLSARSMGYISEADTSLMLTEMAQSKRRIEDIAEASGMNERPAGGQPKYESWVPKGLRYENYREVLTIAYDGKPGPMKALDTSRARGDRAHFRNSGIVVHSRVMDVNNTRFGKTLFIAEVQSDIHQGQRDKRRELLEQTLSDGPNEALLGEAMELGTDEAWGEWETERRTRKRTPEEVDRIMGDPVAPGGGDRYRDIVARRLVARAVLEGYDAIALTSGTMAHSAVGGSIGGQRFFYETKMRSSLEKVLGVKKVGPSAMEYSGLKVLEPTEGSNYGTREAVSFEDDSSGSPIDDMYPVYEITPEAKEKVLRGMPMYSLIEMAQKLPADVRPGADQAIALIAQEDVARYSVVANEKRQSGPTIEDLFYKRMTGAIEKKLSKNSRYSWEEFENAMKNYGIGSNEILWSGLQSVFESREDGKMTGAEIAEVHDEVSAGIDDVVLDGIKDEVHELGPIDSRTKLYISRGADLVLDKLRQAGMHNHIGMMRAIEFSNDTIRDIRGSADDWLSEVVYDDVDGVELGAEVLEEVRGSEWFRTLRGRVLNIGSGDPQESGYPYWIKAQAVKIGDMVSYADNALANSGLPKNVVAVMRDEFLDPVYQMYKHLKKSDYYMIATGGDGSSGIGGQSADDFADAVAMGFVSKGLHNIHATAGNLLDGLYVYGIAKRDAEKHSRLVYEIDSALADLQRELFVGAYAPEQYARGRSSRWDAHFPSEFSKNYREILAIASTKERGPINENARLNSTISSHFRDFKGIVYHARVSDVYANGKKLLFIGEVQSDVHQSRRERFKQLAKERVYPEDEREREDFRRESSLVQQGIITQKEFEENWPALYTKEQIESMIERDLLPLESTWPRVAVRRLVARAVLEGYDGVALTTGSLIWQNVGGTAQQLHGMKDFYERTLKNTIRKAVGQPFISGRILTDHSVHNVNYAPDGTAMSTYEVTEDMEDSDLGSEEPVLDFVPYWEITEAAREKVLRGMPMYSLIEMAQGLPADVRPGAAKHIVSKLASGLVTSDDADAVRAGLVLQDIEYGMAGNVDARTGKYIPAGEVPRFSFVGIDARNWDDIPSSRKFMGADGVMRAEIDTRGSSLTVRPNDFFREHKGVIGDIMKFDELFEAMPILANQPYEVIHDMSDPFIAQYDHNRRVILVNAAYAAFPRMSLAAREDETWSRGVLLHEIQHNIQRVNGWAVGGSNTSEMAEVILRKDQESPLTLGKRIVQTLREGGSRELEEMIRRGGLDIIQQQTAVALLDAYNAKKAGKQYDKDLLNRAGEAAYDLLYGEMEARTVQQNVMEGRAPSGEIRFLDSNDRIQSKLTDSDLLIFYSMGDLGSIAWGAATGTYNAGKGAINMLWQLAFGGRDVRRKIWKKIKNSGFNGVRRSVFTSIDRHMRAVADRVRTHNQDAASIIDDLMNKLNAAPGYGSNGMTFLEARESATADFMNQLRRAVRHLGFDEGERFSLARVWMDEKNEDRYPEMAEAILAIRNGTIDEISDPTTKRGALELKQLLDDIWSYMDRRLIEHGGMKDFNKLENYWPRIISSHKVANNLDEFIQELYTGLKEKSPHYTDQKVMDFARAYAESIAFNDNDASEYLMQSGQADAFYETTGELDDNLPAHLKARRLRIDDKYLNNWTINDPIEVMTRYIHRSVQYAELAKRIGPDMGESTLSRLSKIAIEDTKEANERLLEAERTGDFEAIEKAKMEKKDALKQSEVDRLRNMIYAYQGRLGQGPRSRAGRIAYQGMSSYTALTSLGLVSLAALAEFTAPILTMGGKQGTRSILNALKNLKEGEGFDQEIARQIGTALDQTIEDMMQQYVFSTSTTGSGESGFSRKLGGIMTSFYKWNGLERITRLQRVMATTGARNMIREMLESPRLSVAQEKRAIDLGLPLDAQGRANLLEYVNKLENVSGDQLSKMTSMNPNTNELHREAEMYRAAVLRIARQTIVHPSAATKPLWMSSRNPFLRLAGQLSTFSIAYREGPIAQWQQEMAQNMEAGGDDWDKLAIMLRLIPLLVAQYAVTELRRWVTFGTSEDGREVLARIEQDENQLMKNLGIVLDTNVIGSGSRMFHALESAKYGGNVTSYFGGPWTQKVNVLGDAVWAIMDSGDFEPLFKMAGRSIPVVSQIEIARGPFQDVGTAINEQLGTGRQ